MPTSADLLALRGVAQRATSYGFRLLDSDNQPIGELHPSATNTPSITHDTSRFIQRSIENLLLPPNETRDVNTVSDRIAPYMLLEDGSAWPLGVFLFTETSRPRYSYGSRITGTTVVDQGYVIDHPVEHSVSVAQGEALRTAIIELIQEAGITQLTVESATASAGQPMSWPPGTHRSVIIQDLCIAAGFLPPYFNHDGVCVVQTIFDVEDKQIYVDTDVTYREGENIYAQSIVESDDLLRAPTRYVIIGNVPDQAPIVGVYDVPAGAPYSEYRRGFRITAVRDQQGIATSGDAFTAARAWGINASVYEYVTFNGPPDPRHDAYTVVDFLGERWLEIGWSLPLTASGPMNHRLRKVYA